ncbi:peptidoglycan editing factor PgeF [Orrella sp. JC864]|uniref:peptidoglycan editing factor PgeF n=1 Tax=Orrella sp. JC864 TaxID=3120298 RepID=UPI0012BC82AE
MAELVSAARQQALARLDPVSGPDWPGVRSFCTTRAGGVSQGPYASLNLGVKAGDDPGAVAENRRRLRQALPGEPLWLAQVHGARVLDADGPIEDRQADAAVTAVPDRVLAVMSADCLPVVICDAQARVLGAAHAGWRGLAAGVLENTVAALRRRQPGAQHWRAWVGPGIGPQAFEVGEEVRQAFLDTQAQAEAAFFPARAPGKWWADLYALARMRLAAAGVQEIHIAQRCTASEPQVFFSHRRDRGVTGRQAVLAWLTGTGAG